MFQSQLESSISTNSTPIMLRRIPVMSSRTHLTLDKLFYLVVLSFLLLACQDGTLPAVNYDGLVQDLPKDMAVLDSSMPQDMAMTMIIDQRVMDMALPEDMDVSVDMMADINEGPDGGIPMGDNCDPRLRANACDTGYVCLPIPGGRIHQGNCVEGEECSLIGDSGCPEDRPYCHLRGRSTECTQPSIRGLGEVCLDEFNRSLPCAEGLVCNYSICVPPCDPNQDPTEQCGNNKQCVDLSDQVNPTAGFCGAIGACDLFTNEGCGAGQQCQFAVRPDDQETVYFCSAEGALSEGEICQLGGTGDAGCSVGLICIPSAEGNATCKRVCDTGGYQGPCPDGQACREILSQGGGTYLRGLGLCVINP